MLMVDGDVVVVMVNGEDDGWGQQDREINGDRMRS
jgi:hypothetical protein